MADCAAGLKHRDIYHAHGQNMLHNPSFEEKSTADLAADSWDNWYTGSNIWVMPYEVHIDESFGRTGNRSVHFKTRDSATLYQYFVPPNPWMSHFYASAWFYVPEDFQVGKDILIRCDIYYADGTIDYKYPLTDCGNRIQGGTNSATDGWEYHWGWVTANEMKSIHYIIFYVVNNTFTGDNEAEWWIDDCFFGYAYRWRSESYDKIADLLDDSGDEITEHTTGWSITANSNITRDTVDFRVRNASIKLDHGTRTDNSRMYYNFDENLDVSQYTGVRFFYKTNQANSHIEIRMPDYNRCFIFQLEDSNEQWIERWIPFAEMYQVYDADFPDLQDCAQVNCYMLYSGGTNYFKLDGFRFYKRYAMPDETYPQWMVESYGPGGEDFIAEPLIGSSTALMTDEGTENDSSDYTTSNCTLADNTSIERVGTYCLGFTITNGASGASAYDRDLPKPFFWNEFSHVEFWFCKNTWTHDVDQMKVRLQAINERGQEYTYIAQLNIGVDWCATARWYRFYVPKEAFVPDYADRHTDLARVIKHGFSVDANHGNSGDTFFIDGFDIHLRDGTAVPVECEISPKPAYLTEYVYHASNTTRNFGYDNVQEQTGQVFTATYPVLRGIKVYPASNVGSPTGDVTLSIISVSGSPEVPTGYGWHSATISAEIWDNHVSEYIFIPMCAKLTVGTKYALTLTTTQSGSNYRGVRGHSAGTYEGGHVVTHNGTSWSANTGIDWRCDLVWGVQDRPTKVRFGMSELKLRDTDLPKNCNIQIQRTGYANFSYTENYETKKYLADLLIDGPGDAGDIDWDSGNNRMNLKDEGYVLYHFKFPWPILKAYINWYNEDSSHKTILYVGDAEEDDWFPVSESQGTRQRVNLNPYIQGASEFWLKFHGDNTNSRLNDFTIHGQLDASDVLLHLLPGGNLVSVPYGVQHSSYNVRIGGWGDSEIIRYTGSTNAFAVNLENPEIEGILTSRSTALKSLTAKHGAFLGRETTTIVGMQAVAHNLTAVCDADQLNQLERWKDGFTRVYLLTPNVAVPVVITDLRSDRDEGRVSWYRVNMTAVEVRG